jgi:hypothetical protein
MVSSVLVKGNIQARCEIKQPYGRLHQGWSTIGNNQDRKVVMLHNVVHQSEDRTPSSIRLIATDIDGTLLDSANQLPPANREALEAALERGIRLALVTARKQSSTLDVVELLGMPCAYISHNGARIWDWQGQELQHLVVDKELAREIARFADRHAIPLIMTIDEINYYGPHYPWNPVHQLGDDRRVASSDAALEHPPTRIIVAGTRGVELVHTAFGALAETVVLHRYYSREGTMASAVLTHPHANKADAVARLIEHIGIQQSQVMALGDAEADAGMLAWAGVGVAMGNAMPQAREAATWVAPSHAEAGFAAAVRQFVLKH